MLSGRCAVPDSWTRISRIERIFDSSRRFCFPTDYTDFHRFLTPRGVFAVSLSEYRCLQRRESVQICEICGRLFLNHNAKIRHFIFPTHRCSSLLTDTHQLTMKKETIQKVINFVITVLTAVLSSFCVQSCKWYFSSPTDLTDIHR